MSDSVSNDLQEVLDLIRKLRSEDGCPWDKKQTPETMITCLLNEAYELQEAIQSGDSKKVMDEAGDVLFQLAFIIYLYMEKGDFRSEDVIRKNLEKMINRHPHVFGETEADTVDKVMDNWEKIKQSEKREEISSVLDSIPSGMPSLSRAFMISEKVGRLGFDWDDMNGVLEKVTEEWFELMEAFKEKDHTNISLEFGDLLFTLTNVARFAGIHPETALALAVNKFEKRYRYMETILFKNGKDLISISRSEIDALWEKAKKDTQHT